MSLSANLSRPWAWPNRRQLLANTLGLAALAVVVTVPPALAAPPEPAAWRGQLDALLARAVPAASEPGVVLLVARGDTVLFRQARAMASQELGVALAAEHVLRIGSITKQFAAAAMPQLVDQGRARLDDPLSTWLPDYPGGEAITLARLLNHTPGYVLVGAVIEAITRQPWQAQVAAMLQPLGLQRTTYDALARVIPGRVSGNSRGSRGLERADLIRMTQPHAAGALVSTVDELWRWNLALHRRQVRKAETYQRMTSPEGPHAQKSGYGYGIRKETLRGRPMLQHGGGIPGFKSVLIWLPAEQPSVAVLHTSDSAQCHATPFGCQVAAIVLGEPFPDGPTRTPPLAELEHLQGVWRGAGRSQALRPLAGGMFIFEASTHRLQAIPGTDDMRYFHDGEGEGEVWRRAGALPG